MNISSLETPEPSIKSEVEPQGAYWAQILMLVFIGLVQSQSGWLWSEARILRKIRRRSREDLLSGISSHSVEAAFSELFIACSKGRHRPYGRCFRDIFLLFIIGCDVISFALSTNLFLTDAFMTLRVLIFWGSCTVLGARQPQCFELVFVIFVSGLYLLSLILFGSGVLAIPEKRIGTLLVFRVGCFVFESLNALGRGIYAYLGKTADISAIAASIRDNKMKQGSRQSERFEKMLTMLPDCATGNFKSWQHYWHISFSNWAAITVSAFIFATNGMHWGISMSQELPKVIVLETLDLVSAILFFLNDTQVENILFIELLDLAVYHTERV